MVIDVKFFVLYIVVGNFGDEDVVEFGFICGLVVFKCGEW